MKLFDLHCDTLTEIKRKGERLNKNSCHIALDDARDVFDSYTQVLAIWSDNRFCGEENYRRFQETVDYATPELVEDSFFHPILAVEGGDLLCGKLERVDVLASRSVKIFTPVWQGNCCIGGAYDTVKGLTPFGFAVIERCFSLGIVPDLSHASDRMFEEIYSLAKSIGKPMIASHSCSRELCRHPRNLSDEMARRIAETDGVIGVNLVAEHLGEPSLDAVVHHILHLINVAGEDRVCLGCDFDGTDSLPKEIRGIRDLPLLAEMLRKYSHSEQTVEKVFYSNAQNFQKRYLG